MATNKDLKRLFDKANDVYYDGKLPKIPICFDEYGNGLYNGHLHFEPSKIYIGVHKDLQRLPSDSEVIVTTILHEMVHEYMLYFNTEEWRNDKGHGATFQRIAASHGLEIITEDGETTDRATSEAMSILTKGIMKA